MWHNFKYLLILFTLSGFLFAGNTGKISGQITSSETSEPLIGANVIILGTDLGASTDNEGEYFIINVPAGTHSIKIMMIGYQTMTFTDVAVSPDLTTQVNTSMVETVLAGEEVNVTAKKPVIQKDVT